MPQRFCPFAFFSFHVNKNSAEAGGCHHCVEHACALWDVTEQQCGVKSALDSVGVIADAVSSGGIPMVQTKPDAGDVKAGVSSLFDKLRSRKKLPSAQKLPSADKPTKVVTEENKVKTPEQTTETNTKPSTDIASSRPTDDLTKVDPTTIVNPATIETKVNEKKNPVGTVHTSPTKKETAEKHKSAPELLEEMKVVAPPPPPPPMPAIKPQNTISASPVKLPKVESKPLAEETNVSKLNPIDEAANKLAELEDFDDDFSDLLNPPPIDVTQLPIISTGKDRVKDDDENGG